MRCLTKCFACFIGGFERSQGSLKKESVFTSDRRNSDECEMDEIELPLFDFNTISMATDNFSEENKLGEGGFGSVYKVKWLYFKHLSRNPSPIISHSKIMNITKSACCMTG